MELKELLEKRREKQREMLALVNKADEEKRTMSEEEVNQFEAAEAEVRTLDANIEAVKKAREMSLEEPENEEEQEQRTLEEAEERAFERFLRSESAEERADVNWTRGDNGAVIPTSIANRILEKVKDVCPIWAMAETFNLKGDLTFPVYDESEQKVTMAYAEEFKALTSTSGTFTSKTLKGYLAGCLTKVSRSLINNSAFPIVEYVIGKVAEAVTLWMEHEMLIGTAGKIEGMSTITQTVTTAAAVAITTDELIDLQEEIPDVFQSGAIWIMNRSTRKAIRKLKDADGNYLLNRDLTSTWGYTLLGKPVYCSDAMPGMEAGKTVISYGDPSGLYAKVSEGVEIQVLQEKYADEHAIGVVAWMEMDAKVIEPQKMAQMKMGA
ncbi:phage major capsid protein [Clostridiales bacterium]|nr:phage major capsid protein [Clostridiales bacterium]